MSAQYLGSLLFGHEGKGRMRARFLFRGADLPSTHLPTSVTVEQGSKLDSGKKKGKRESGRRKGYPKF